MQRIRRAVIGSLEVASVLKRSWFFVGSARCLSGEPLIADVRPKTKP
jgi:hypothetical protein